MRPDDYAFLCGLLKQRSGLVLGPDKLYLVESRLMPVAKKHGLTTLDMLVQRLRAPGAERLAADVTEAMTTNESFFFRDKTPFDQFEQVALPELLRSRASQRRIRIWCAAASTGQEPYSLAMILSERQAQLAGWRVEIIGTDLSLEVLEKAKAGVYTQFEVQRGLPIQYLMRYFTKTGETWQIRSDIRAMVDYRTFNLLTPFAGLGTFDLIFCRNVLIYFDCDTKADVLNRMAACLAPDGYLVLGAAETVLGVTNVFSPLQGGRGYYVREGHKSGVTIQPAVARG